MAKGDAAKYRLIAEEISARFFEENKQYLDSTTSYEVLYFAVENILAGLLFFYLDEHKLPVVLQVLEAAVHKSLERKTETKMEKFIYGDAKEKLNG